MQKRHRKKSLKGAYCKYKHKWESKHDDINDKKVLTENEKLKNTVEEVLIFKTYGAQNFFQP